MLIGIPSHWRFAPLLMGSLQTVSNHLARTSTGHLAKCPCGPPACTLSYTLSTGVISWTSSTNGSEAISSVTLGGAPVAFNGSSTIGSPPLTVAGTTLVVTNACGATATCELTFPCEWLYTGVRVTISGLPASATAGSRTITGLDSVNGTHDVPWASYNLSGAAQGTIYAGSWSYTFGPISNTGDMQINPWEMKTRRLTGTSFSGVSDPFQVTVPVCPATASKTDIWNLGFMGSASTPTIQIGGVSFSAEYYL